MQYMCGFNVSFKTNRKKKEIIWGGNDENQTKNAIIKANCRKSCGSVEEGKTIIEDLAGKSIFDIGIIKEFEQIQNT